MFPSIGKVPHVRSKIMLRDLSDFLDVFWAHVSDNVNFLNDFVRFACYIVHCFVVK